jgi:hypothetical protein
MHQLRLMPVVLAIAFSPFTAAADQRDAPAAANGGPRIRPYDSRSAALLVEGIARSASLRRVIDRIEQTDLIVYVEMQPALRGRVAGSLTWLTKTPQFRYVRISLSPEYFGDAAVALLGHELQHAVEVAGEPSIVDPASLEAFYRRVGNAVGLHSSGWDTEAARVMGDDVRRELLLRGTRAAIESIEPFDPMNWHNVYRRARALAR